MALLALGIAMHIYPQRNQFSLWFQNKNIFKKSENMGILPTVVCKNNEGFGAILVIVIIIVVLNTQIIAMIFGSNYKSDCAIGFAFFSSCYKALLQKEIFKCISK